MRVINYPTWLVKIVLVPKRDGNIRIYVDYRDFNKFSPKDDFPLPNIHILIGLLCKIRVAIICRLLYKISPNLDG